MNLKTKRMRKNLISWILAVLVMTITGMPMTVQAAGPTDPQPGIVRIKLQPEVAKTVAKNPRQKASSGPIKSGVTALDNALNLIDGVEIRPMLPANPKFADERAKYGLDQWYVVTFDKKQSSVDVRKRLSNVAGIMTAEVVKPMSFKEGNGGFRVSKASEATKAAVSYPFNDPRLPDQWHYKNYGDKNTRVEGADINLFEAWKTTTGSKDVTVAIIDGGIDYTHEDLAANMFINEAEKNGVEGKDDDGNGYVDDIYGFNFCTMSGTIYPHSHGTHVAGTVGAVNNNGIGVAGVAGGDGTEGSGVKLLSCQVFDSRQSVGEGDFAAAIVYAAEMGATIAQCSWGWADADYYEQAVLDAIDYFTAKAHSKNMTGGLMIFAAGNEGATGNFYPACYPKVLSVAAMTADLGPANYSCYGDWVDVIAPGGFQTYNQNDGVLSTMPNNEYGYSEGTSMATPHVSGIAALILSKYGKESYVNESLRTQLVSSVKDFYGYGDNEQFRGEYGSGYIDAAKALIMGDGTAPQPVTDFTLTAAQDFIHIDWTVPESSEKSVYSHIIYYSTEPIPADGDLAGVSRLVVDTQFLSSGDKYSAEITDLTPLTEYYVAMVAVNRWGDASTLSEVKNIRTNEGPKMTLDKTKVSLTGTAASPVGEGTFTIGNEASGILKWETSKTSVGISTLSMATRRSDNAVPGKPMKQFEGKMGIRPNASASSELVSSDYEVSDYPKDIKYYNQYYAVIAENDLSLPNSMAQLFYVDPAVHPNGFNLTSLLVDYTYGKNPKIEIYKGPNALSAATKLADVTYSWFAYNYPIKLQEQINFKPGESFWVVVHFEGGQSDYCLPCAIHREEFDYIDTYSWMSNDMGETWVRLKDALVGSPYEDISDQLTWGIYVRSDNPDFSDLVEVDPSKGTVNGGESQVVTAKVDGSKLINGTYKANINISTNQTENKVAKLPVEYRISGQTPNIQSPEVVDFGSLLVGQSKTLTVEVFNEGYGSMWGSKWQEALYSSNIQSTSEHFAGPGYIGSGVPARSRVSFDVTYTPKSAGSHNGNIILKGDNNYEVRIFVRGVATDPSKLGVDPAEVDAGTLTIGEDAKEVTFKVVNEGNYPLEYVMPKFSDKTIAGGTKLHKFGYTVASNIDGYASDRIEYTAPTKLGNAIDISSKFSENVNMTEPISIGFDFPYYGERYDHIYITNFGAVCFAPNTLTLREPMSPQSADIVGLGLISAYGRIVNMGENSKIEYGRQDGKFVISYSNVMGLAYNGMGEFTPISFRIALSPNGDIEMYYDDYNGPEMFQGGCTLFCGINDFQLEDILEVTGADIALWKQWIEWGYLDRELTEENQRHTKFVDGTVVKFMAPKGNFIRSVDKPYGMINPGESVEVKATVSADNTLNAGESYNDIAIASNDPNQTVKGVRIKATIEGDELIANPCWENNNVNLGEVYRTADVVVPATLMNKGNRDMVVTGMRFDAEKTDISFVDELTFPFTIKAGESRDIMVTIPTDASGEKVGVVEAIISNNNEDQYLPFSITATVIGCPEVELGFTEVNETVESGSPLHKDLTITNTGDEDMTYSIIPNSIARMTLPENANAETNYAYSASGDNANVTFGWEDIETNGKGQHTGIATYLLTDFVEVDLPFAFPYYGKTYNKMYIYNTGFVSFSSHTDENIWPEPPAEFPKGSDYTNVIAPYWGLHSPYQTTTSGTYHYVTEDRVVVSWMEYANSINFEVCFQLIMEKDGTFKFQYKGLSEQSRILGTFGVAGCSNEGATQGVRIPDYLIAFNKAVQFTPIVESTLAPNASETVGFDFVTNKMQGVYTSNINVKTNIPRKEDINIPVTLNITGVAAPVMPTDCSVEHPIGYYSKDVDDPNSLVSQGAAFEVPFSISNTGTAPFIINNVVIDSPEDPDYSGPLFVLYGYLNRYDPWFGVYTEGWTMCYPEVALNTEVSDKPVRFSIPVMYYDSFETTTYEIPVHVTYTLEGDTEPRQHDFTVTITITPAPVIDIEQPELVINAPEDDSIITDKIKFGNAGEYKLTYDLVLDPTGVGEEIEEGGGGGIAPWSNGKPETNLTADVIAELSQIREAGVVSTITTLDKPESTHQYDVPQNFEYNDALYYDHFSNTSYQYGANNTYDVFKAATQFTAPADGFNISHLYMAATCEDLEDYNIKFEIIQGNDPDGENVIGTANLVCEPSTAGTGRFYVVALDKPVFMNPNEEFVVVATYDAGMLYPAYCCTKQEKVIEGRYQGWIESYGWFDLGVLFQDTYGSIGYIMTCLETTEGQPWVRLLSPESGSVEVEEYAEVEIELNAAAARMEKNNKAMLVIKSNDPMTPVVNYPITLNCNGKPVINVTDSKLNVKEGEPVNVEVTISDPDGDDMVVDLIDGKGYASIKTIVADPTDTEAALVINEDGSYNIHATMPVVMNVEINAGYGTWSTGNKFQIVATDVKNHVSRETVRYDIEYVNQPPVALDVPTITVAPDQFTDVINFATFFEDPDNDRMKFTFEMNKNSYVDAYTTDYGVIFNGKRLGTATAIVTADDGKGGVTSNTIEIEVSDKVGIDGINGEANGTLVVLQNPVEEWLNASCGFDAIDATFTLYSAAGAVVAKEQRNVSNGDVLAMNVSDLTAGVYLLVAEYDGNRVAVRVVKR